MDFIQRLMALSIIEQIILIPSMIIAVVGLSLTIWMGLDQLK